MHHGPKTAVVILALACWFGCSSGSSSGSSAEGAGSTTPGNAGTGGSGSTSTGSTVCGIDCGVSWTCSSGAMGPPPEVYTSRITDGTCELILDGTPTWQLQCNGAAQDLKPSVCQAPCQVSTTWTTTSSGIAITTTAQSISLTRTCTTGSASDPVARDAGSAAPTACKQAEIKMKAVLDDPSLNACSGSHDKGPASTECVQIDTSQLSTNARAAMGCLDNFVAATTDMTALVEGLNALAPSSTAGCGACASGPAVCSNLKPALSKPVAWCEAGACRGNLNLCVCASGDYYILPSMACNGTADCPDGSDEVGCR